MHIEHDFFVGIQDVGSDYRVNDKAIVEMLSNIASIHGRQIGQARYDGNTNIAWMVLNWRLEIIDRPRVGENVRVKTWSEKYDRLKAYRDYIIYNPDGSVAVKAISNWIAVDFTKMKPVFLTEELMAPYKSEMDEAVFPGYEFPRRVDVPDLCPLATMEYKIPRFMIDLNEHVHNACYLDIAGEVLPENIAGRHFDNIFVNFAQEISPGETVLVEYIENDNHHYVRIKTGDGSKLHGVVEMY